MLICMFMTVFVFVFVCGFTSRLRFNGVIASIDEEQDGDYCKCCINRTCHN